jgi:hypothetical protein
LSPSPSYRRDFRPAVSHRTILSKADASPLVERVPDLKIVRLFRPECGAMLGTATCVSAGSRVGQRHDQRGIVLLRTPSRLASVTATTTARHGRLIAALYTLHGGVLRVYYGADGRVAGLSTTSAYYTTPSGCGVGVNDSAASPALAGQSAGTYASLLGPGSLCMSDLREAVEPGRP